MYKIPPVSTSQPLPPRPGAAHQPAPELDLLIAGLGGMGAVGLTQRLVELLRGRYPRVFTREARGFAQRRAAVACSLRAGRRVRSADLVSGANLLLALEPAEALRHLHLLRPGAQVVLCDHCVWPAGFAGAERPPLPVAAVAERLRAAGAEVLVLPVCDWLRAHRLPALFLASAALGACAALAGLPFAQVAERLAQTWPAGDRGGNLLLARLGHALARGSQPAADAGRPASLAAAA